MNSESSGQETPSVGLRTSTVPDAPNSFDVLQMDDHPVTDALSLTTCSAFGGMVDESCPSSKLSRAITLATPSVSTALVPKAVLNDFSGHGAGWLNAAEIKVVTGNPCTGPLERPSMLNALAFKCGGAECVDGQSNVQSSWITVG